MAQPHVAEAHDQHPDFLHLPSIHVCEHPQIITQMHEARKIAGRDAAKFVIAPQKRRGIQRRHAQGIFEADAEPLHAIAHRLIHGQIGAGKRSILELQPAIHAA